MQKKVTLKAKNRSPLSKMLGSFGGILAVLIVAMGALAAMIAVQMNSDNRQQAKFACPEPGGKGCLCNKQEDCRNGYKCDLSKRECVPDVGGPIPPAPTTPPEPDETPVPTNSPSPTNPPAPTNPPKVLGCGNVSVTAVKQKGAPRDGIYNVGDIVRIGCGPISGAQQYRFLYNRIGDLEVGRMNSGNVRPSLSRNWTLDKAGSYVIQCRYQYNNQWSPTKPWPGMNLGLEVPTTLEEPLVAAQVPGTDGNRCRVRFEVVN